MHFYEEIKYIISLKTFSNYKKRSNAIKGAFYAKTKPCYILGNNNFQLKEAWMDKKYQGPN